MKVSIITPVYNGMKYFPLTLASVDEIDYVDYEHIIVDDCSTDGTFEKLRDDNPKRMWFQNEKNMGESHTVNRAYEIASGDLILVLNSDDLIAPDLINHAVERFLQKPTLDVVYPDWNMIDQNGKILQVINTHKFDARILFEDFNCIPGPGAVFRNKIVSPLRDTTYKWAGDYDQWLRLAKTDNFERIPIVLASWRKHEGAQTHQRGLEMAKERILLVKNAFKRENSNNFNFRHSLGAAYYFAARLVFFDSRIPSTFWLLKSYAFRPLNARKSIFQRPIMISILLAFPFLLPLVRAPFQTFPVLQRVLLRLTGPEFSRRFSDAISRLE
jgi:glycosyltransferase involved in cell wall biosynthesis